MRQQLWGMDRGEMEWAIYLEALYRVCGSEPMQTGDILLTYQGDSPPDELLASTPLCIYSLLQSPATKLTAALNKYLMGHVRIVTPSGLLLWNIQNSPPGEILSWGDTSLYWLIYRVGTQTALGGDTVLGRIYG